jgi:hypothetical protein
MVASIRLGNEERRRLTGHPVPEGGPHLRGKIPAELAALTDWVLGLPWVIERAEFAQAPGVRCIAVECDLLDRRRIWLLVGDIGWEGTDNHLITLVLSAELSDHALAAVSATLVAELPSGHRLVSVPTPRHESEFAALRTLMLAAYMGALQ